MSQKVWIGFHLHKEKRHFYVLTMNFQTRDFQILKDAIKISQFVYKSTNVPIQLFDREHVVRKQS